MTMKRTAAHQRHLSQRLFGSNLRREKVFECIDIGIESSKFCVLCWVRFDAAQ